MNFPTYLTEPGRRFQAIMEQLPHGVIVKVIDTSPEDRIWDDLSRPDMSRYTRLSVIRARQIANDLNSRYDEACQTWNDSIEHDDWGE
jgi:hypothetical protein